MDFSSLLVNILIFALQPSFQLHLPQKGKNTYATVQTTVVLQRTNDLEIMQPQGHNTDQIHRNQ